jgi:hypothetical protein
LNSGFIDESGHESRLPLELAAQRVGVSKKTLDDYMA